MTPEGRLDRIERIAKLFARAGRRVRSDVRDQNEKINILIDLHMKNEELFARNEERFAKNEELFARNEKRFAKNEERFAKNEAKNEERFAKQDENIETLFKLQVRTDEKFVALAEAQADSNRRLSSLIDVIREGRGTKA